jgi:hypothetical protein
MNEKDLQIFGNDGKYVVKVFGRANFQYAVPLRDLVLSLDGFEYFKFEMSDCQAMDSTFMGVLTMIALKGDNSDGVVEIWNASDFIKKLLVDLGVDDLFEFNNGQLDITEDAKSTTSETTDRLAVAKTVVEAHETLAEANEDNVNKFKAVIELSREELKAEEAKEVK